MVGGAWSVAGVTVVGGLWSVAGRWAVVLYYAPVQTTEWNCFAENWTSTGIPQEIDHKSKFI